MRYISKTKTQYPYMAMPTVWFFM